MANTFTSDVSFDASAPEASTTASTGVSGFFKSITEKFATMRQQRVDAEVGQFIESHGGQLTDDLERQISRRFGSPSGQW